MSWKGFAMNATEQFSFDATKSGTMAAFMLNMPLPAKNKDIQDIEWQLKTVEEAYDKLYTPRTVRLKNFDKGLYGIMLRGGTGIGKMYITCELIRKMVAEKKLTLPEGSNCPFPVVWILPANMVIQTTRVLKSYGIAHLVHVMTYHAFRSNTNPYVEWVDVGHGEEELVPRWKEDWTAALYVIDECQGLRNPQTSTTKVALAMQTLTHGKGCKVIFASATPYQRLCESRAALCVMGVVTEFNQLPMTNETFPHVMGDMAAHGKTMYDYSPKSMENLRKSCDLWYVEPKNVRFKFSAKTELLEIDLTPEKRERYDIAYQEYLRKIWETQRRTGPQGILAKWVALGKFQEKAELLRADTLAEMAIAEVKSGRQVIVGSKYVNTLRAVWTHLTKKLGVSPDDIAFVVGGQDKNKRQVNIDAFQAGAARYMLLMMKAGGIGLSLHHDRTSMHSWPRTVLLPPTYAAPELVQVLGRGHRLTSLSQTVQKVIWYRGTVESDKVLPKIRIKLKCLDAAVVAKEQWGHFLEAGSDAEAEKLGEQYSESYSQAEHSEFDAEKEQTEESEIELITGEGLNNEED